MRNKIIAILLAFTLAFSVFAVPVSAIDDFSNAEVEWSENGSSGSYFDASEVTDSGNVYVSQGQETKKYSDGNVVWSTSTSIYSYNSKLMEYNSAENELIIADSNDNLQILESETGNQVKTEDLPLYDTSEYLEGAEKVSSYNGNIKVVVGEDDGNNKRYTLWEYDKSTGSFSSLATHTANDYNPEDIEIYDDKFIMTGGQDSVRVVDGINNYQDINVNVSYYSGIAKNNDFAYVVSDFGEISQIDMSSGSYTTKKITQINNWQEDYEGLITSSGDEILVGNSDTEKLYLLNVTTENVESFDYSPLRQEPSKVDSLISSNNGKYLTITYLTELTLLNLNVINAQSLDSTIEGNTNSYTSTGSNEFDVNSDALFSDGSTEDVTNNVSYSYDSSIVTRVSGNTFEGTSVGTTDIQTSYTDESGNTVTDSTTVTIEKPVASTQLVYPSGDNTDLVGTEDFTVATELTYQNGTTELADDSDVTYSYDSNIIENTGDVATNAETFAGLNSGTTGIQSTYTGFAGETETSNSDTVTVSDPPEIENVKIISPNDFTYDEGETKDLDVELEYSDGSAALITSSQNLNFSSSNSTIVSVNENSGSSTANLYGEAKISVSYVDSWYGTSHSTDTNVTVLGDPSNIDFNIEESEVERDKNASMSAILNYEDGRTEDIEVNTSNISSSPSGYATFDNVNDTVAFSESNITYTLTYTYDGFSDSDTIFVEPVPDFEDFNKLSPSEQIFAIFDNWSFWAMIVSILGGVLVGIKLGSGAGIGSMTILLALSWIGGFIPIYIPITLILFEIFLFTVLDVSLVDFS